MSYDYGPAAAKAKALVEKFGRQVTFVRLSGTPADNTKPWAAPTTAGKTTKDYAVVNLEPGNAGKLGLNVEVLEFLKKSSRLYIVATSDDLEVYHKVIDGTQTFAITGMTALKPGDTTLLWYVGAGG